MKKEIYVIAQNIRSLYNVGSIFRTCDAFDVNKLYLCGYTGYPPRKEISKTALGAEKNVVWQHNWRTVDLIQKLKNERVDLVALELTQNSKPLKDYKPKFPLALIIGNEKTGVSPKILQLADKKIFIPMQGIKESLNVSVAFGIALYRLSNDF